MGKQRTSWSPKPQGDLYTLTSRTGGWHFWKGYIKPQCLESSAKCLTVSQGVDCCEGHFRVLLDQRIQLHVTKHATAKLVTFYKQSSGFFLFPNFLTTHKLLTVLLSREVGRGKWHSRFCFGDKNVTFLRV